jgi:hypothetical protein
VALKSENLPMGWKEAIYTYPSSIVYEIHGVHMLFTFTEPPVSESIKKVNT